MLINIHKRPSARQIQPIGFWGRLEAIRAPTTGKARRDKKISVLPTVPTVTQAPGDRADLRSTSSAAPAMNIAKDRPASDHASQERAPLLPTPRPRSLASSATTLLYSNSRLLVVTGSVLRGVIERLERTPDNIPSEGSICRVPQPVTEFGVAHKPLRFSNKSSIIMPGSTSRR